jgi:hypothetical protein
MKSLNDISVRYAKIFSLIFEKYFSLEFFIYFILFLSQISHTNKIFIVGFLMILHMHTRFLFFLLFL